MERNWNGIIEPTNDTGKFIWKWNGMDKEIEM